MTPTIPLIGISPCLHGSDPDRRAVANTVDAACADMGFLLVSAHGISAASVDDMRRVSMAFFERPLEEKLRYRMPPDRYRGFIVFGNEALAYSLDEQTPPDLKESFSIGPVDAPDDPYRRAATPANFFAPNMRPDGLPEFQGELDGLLSPHGSAGDDADANLRDGTRHGRELFRRQDRPPHHELQRAPLSPAARSFLAWPTPCWRAHRLWKPDHREARCRRGRPAGSCQGWRLARRAHMPDAFVVNLGDLMAEWTNDRWVPTLHRVVNPSRAAGEAARRLSMTFFHQPNYDAVVQCLPTCTDAARPPRYGTTTSGQHVWMKVNKQRQGELAADP